MRLLTMLLLCLLVTGCAGEIAKERVSLRAEQLECEYRANPEGIASTSPRLSWRLRAVDSSERGVSMSAYRLIAGASPQALSKEADLAWDSGVVRRASRDGPMLPTRTEYAGKALASRNRLWWKVKVWDQAGRDCGWSDIATWSVGLLKESEWQGVWIGLDAVPKPPLTNEVRDELRRLPWIRQPGPASREPRTALFRTEFHVSGEVAEAWIAGTADMIAELSVNGAAIGTLARWELVRPIDIREQLVPGPNEIGVRVENYDGLNPAVSGMLVVTYVDGRVQKAPMDRRWKFGSLPEGGWGNVSFDEHAWQPVEESARQPWSNSRNTEHFIAPAPYLRTEFSVSPEKRVTRAMLYATALGVYECHINGQKVGNAELAPGWTEYSKRVEHQGYDVTSLLRPGANCLGALLGDGWYAGLMGYTGQRRYYGEAARFLGQLEVEYEDGTRLTVATGPGWKGSFGPLLWTDNYMGSGYDARLEMPGWDMPGFADSSWQAIKTGIATRPRREADVTESLRGMVHDDSLSLVVGPAVLGDPAYGVVKSLEVDYTVGGTRRRIVANEGVPLALPREGERGALVINHATFAEPMPAAAPKFVIEPQTGEPVRRSEELSARSVREPRKGRYVFDLGQNMVGWARLSVNGRPGQRLIVRHAEMLNPDGTLYTSNLRGATATDVFILKGGPEVLEPRFTFHGFRYVEIAGLDSEPPASMVTGVVIHTSMRPAGSFTCSSPLVNQLVRNIVWSQRGNYLEVPTDCPQRDERLGWTGDAQFFVNTAAYTFDIASFMSRWLRTLAQDAQFADGTFAHVAPKVNERGGSTAWGDAAIVCTYAMYMTYADTRVICDNYDAMGRYMTWLDSKTNGGITKVGGYGDWLNLGDPTSQELIDTAYRVHLCRLMSEMAMGIGKSHDAKRFKEAYEDSLRAFQKRFVRPDGSLKDSGQTGYALAFTMGLVPPELSEKTAAHFAAALERKNWHLATGFIGTPRLLPGLHAAGRDDLAARLLLNEDYPSWLYQVKLGATTMWERWDGWTPERGFQDVGMNSFNHYAFGSVGDYLYRHVAGIAPLAPGYSRVLIAPALTPGLDHAEATYESAAGLVESAWRMDAIDNGARRRWTYTLAIPPNVSAEVRLPMPSGVQARDVREGGRRLEDSAGVRVIDDAGPDAAEGTLRMELVSGTYRFEMTEPELRPAP